MITLYQTITNQIARRPVAWFETFAEAKAFAAAHYAIVYGEDDADHPDCWDAMTTGGDILTIQPTD